MDEITHVPMRLWRILTFVCFIYDFHHYWLQHCQDHILVALAGILKSQVGSVCLQLLDVFLLKQLALPTHDGRRFTLILHVNLTEMFTEHVIK